MWILALAAALLSTPAFELYLLDDTGQRIPKVTGPFETEVDRPAEQVRGALARRFFESFHISE